jgi:hypothetical protein
MSTKPDALLNRVVRAAAASRPLSALGYKRPFLPKRIYSDDVFLVSFPKSGNTWVRFLLGNILTGNQCHWGNVDQIVPEVVRNREECERLARPRVMKSHLPYTAQMPRVIYVVRDGRDVAVSYYFHLLKKKKLQKNVSFDEYLDRFNRGLYNPQFGTWGSHVLSWLDHWSADYLLVAYEDLKRDPDGELAKITRYVGLDKTQAEISAAVVASDFKKMKALEQEQSNLYHDFAGTDASIPFMRTGRSGGWKEYFSGKAEREFELRQGEALRRLNYVS